MKPSKFDYLPFKDSGNHKEFEALQVPLMVISGSNNLDETPEPSQIRVSEIRFSMYHTPPDIISLNANSSWKAPDSSDISLSTYFNPLSADMHQPLYSNLFVEGRTLAIVSNLFYCCLAITYCSQIQGDDVLKSNHSTSLLPKMLLVNSSHPWESKEFDLLNSQYMTVKTSNQINNLLIDSILVSTNNDSPVNLTKPMKFDSSLF